MTQQVKSHTLLGVLCVCMTDTSETPLLPPPPLLLQPQVQPRPRLVKALALALAQVLLLSMVCLSAGIRARCRHTLATSMADLPIHNCHSAIPSAVTSSELEQPTCSICLCDYDEGDAMIVLPCRHRYHAPCIKQWLKINRVSSSHHIDLLCAHAIWQPLWPPFLTPIAASRSFVPSALPTVQSQRDARQGRVNSILLAVVILYYVRNHPHHAFKVESRKTTLHKRSCTLCVLGHHCVPPAYNVIASVI